MRTILILFTFLISSHLVYSEIITLKNGKTIDVSILERTNEYIKVDISGVPIKYYSEEIESIDGVTLKKARRITPLPQTTTDDIGVEHIRRILKKLEYPKHAWPALEQKLVMLFKIIDFKALKIKSDSGQLSSSQLKRIAKDIWLILESNGYLNYQQPHPLMVSLVNSLGQEDIRKLIESSQLSPVEKDKYKQAFFACTATSQLGAIILSLAGIDVKCAFSISSYYDMGHVFNYIYVNPYEFLLVDFTNDVFEIITIENYYQRNGRGMSLRGDYWWRNVDKIRDAAKQWAKGERSFSQEMTLNILYQNIYLGKRQFVTDSILSNYAQAYALNADYEKAIAYCKQALQINPNSPFAYANRAFAYMSQNKYDQAIDDCNQALEIYPKYAGGYSILGNIYAKQGDFDRAIKYYNQAIFENQNSARVYFLIGKAYFEKGNYYEAVSNYRQALRIDSTHTFIYNDLARTYLFLGEYEKSILCSREVLKFQPNNAYAYNNLGAAYIDLNGTKKAWEYLLKAKKLFLKQGNSERVIFIDEVLKNLAD